MIYLYIALPIIFAILNRVRGDEIYWLKIPMHSTSKIIVSLILAFIAYHNTPDQINFWSLSLGMYAAYRIGELWGTGKWIGVILDHREEWFDDNQEGDAEGRKSGILYLTNLFIDEHEDFLNHCRLALAIRGFYWWFPVLLVCYLANSITAVEMIISSLILGPAFTISTELGRWSWLKYGEQVMDLDISELDNPWEIQEVIYGFIHGLVFAIIFYF